MTRGLASSGITNFPASPSSHFNRGFPDGLNNLRAGVLEFPRRRAGDFDV
jgi:hypothetical protein